MLVRHLYCDAWRPGIVAKKLSPARLPRLECQAARCSVELDKEVEAAPLAPFLIHTKVIDSSPDDPCQNSLVSRHNLHSLTGFS